MNVEHITDVAAILRAFPANPGEVDGRITEKGSRVLDGCADILIEALTQAQPATQLVDVSVSPKHIVEKSVSNEPITKALAAGSSGVDEEEEYMTVTLSREGVVTSHNAFDASFDEMVTATDLIIRTLQTRLANRLLCPFSSGKALRGKHPVVDARSTDEAGGGRAAMARIIDPDAYDALGGVLSPTRHADACAKVDAIRGKIGHASGCVKINCGGCGSDFYSTDYSAPPTDRTPTPGDALLDTLKAYVDGPLHQGGLTMGLVDAQAILAALTNAGRGSVEDGGLAAIAGERRRQVEIEGWTPDHDDKHGGTQLAGAAASYVLASIDHWAGKTAAGQFWPWSASCWKPRDRRSNLVRAGALIAAEIDRLDRAPKDKP